MKTRLIIACIVGGIFALGGFPEVPICFVLVPIVIAVGVITIISWIFDLASQLHYLIFCIEEIEGNIMHILDKAKNSWGCTNWLTFDQIFNLAGAMDSMKGGYYIALNNLIRNEMVKLRRQGEKNLFHLITEEEIKNA